jgi:hypothetical protein
MHVWPSPARRRLIFAKGGTMSTIGLDIGTTGCKAVVFSDQGETLGQAAPDYAILTPQPGWAEQDAELVWQLAWEALSEAVSQSRGSTELSRQVYRRTSGGRTAGWPKSTTRQRLWRFRYRAKRSFRSTVMVTPFAMLFWEC